jgi:hypothetical protein
MNSQVRFFSMELVRRTVDYNVNSSSYFQQRNMEPKTFMKSTIAYLEVLCAPNWDKYFYNTILGGIQKFPDWVLTKYTLTAINTP